MGDGKSGIETSQTKGAKRPPFFICNKTHEFRFIGMRINASTSSVSFYPFIEFTGVTTATIEVYHKPTKTKVQATNAVTLTNSKVTINTPSLAPITSVAQNLDEILIRVTNGSGNLIWEYLGYWVTGTTDLYRDWKSWDSTASTTKEWITL